METNIFHDIIGNISLANGIVRIDFFDEVPQKPEASATTYNLPKEYVFTRRLNLSIPAFVQSYELMTVIMDTLAKENVIKRKES